MTADAIAPARQQREERLNALTHGVGAVASIAGAAILITMAALTGDTWRIVGTAIFSCTLIALYSASTIYHVARSKHLKARLQVIDHAAIYLLIAGTYTPFTLVSLRGGWGWALFGVIWGLAVAGVAFKLFFTGRFHRISTAIYLLMGWLIVIAIVPALRNIEPATLAWLAAGGLTYTAGVFFFHSRRIPYAHAIWHLFVVGGSVCHAIAVGMQLA